MKRNGQTQLNFDVLSSTEMLDIVVLAPFIGRGKPRYKRGLGSFYTCHLELFLVARDKRHSTARLPALTVQTYARDPLSGSHKYRSITMMGGAHDKH